LHAYSVLHFGNAFSSTAANMSRSETIEMASLAPNHRGNINSQVSPGYLETYRKATQTPGTAECLSTLLTGPDFSCPHTSKLVPGLESRIPIRLGFFHRVKPDSGYSFAPHRQDEKYLGGEKYLTYLETNKLCLDCYDRAVPDGFSVWSLPYETITPSYYFPPQIAAGHEHFERGGVVDIDELKTEPGQVLRTTVPISCRRFGF